MPVIVKLIVIHQFSEHLAVDSNGSFPIFERLFSGLEDEFLGRDEFTILAAVESDAANVDTRTSESLPDQFAFQTAARDFEITLAFNVGD